MPEFAGFDPKQPRVLKGQGDHSGEWTQVSSAESHGHDNIPAPANGRTVTIMHDDGSVETRKGGSRSWRNNNPGNLKIEGGFAKRHGAIGSDGRFAIFPDQATGEAAAEALLSELYASLTIDQAIEKRTPSKDMGNNTERTKQLVQQFSGLPGNAIVGRLNPADRHSLFNAIRRAEGWIEGVVTRGTP